MTGHSTAITLMDILKQAIEKNWHVEFKRQAEEQKQRDFTHHHVLNIYLHNVPFTLDLTDKRSTSELMTSAISMMQNAI